MHVSAILAALPAVVDWLVLFRLDTMRALAPDEVVRAMFFLDAGAALDGSTHAVLTSHGRYLASADTLIPADAAAGGALEGKPPSLLERFRAELSSAFDGRGDLETIDCLGLGHMAPFPPVVLAVRAQDGIAAADAIFAAEPPREGYELLRAAGVRYLGGAADGHVFRARFENRLPRHIDAAALASFTRTAHCNLFFLRHGHLDETLTAGLARALEARVGRARDALARGAVRLAQIAVERPLPMICEPPAPEAPYAYGDLVPLGFLARALDRISAPPAADAAGALERLRGHLAAAKQDGLWAFHSGRLITATDSALVLQGMPDVDAVRALERFRDGERGYVPQQWSDVPRPGRMVAAPCNAHWRQVDFATTCMVEARRREAGLPVQVPLAWFEQWIDRRAGLYFANPYLVDWVLADALEGRADAAALRRRLAADVLASVNDDGSFGTFDVPLSTALAILTLASLGERSRAMALAQLWLAEHAEQGGQWTGSTPFFSSFQEPGAAVAGAPGAQRRAVDDTVHDISLYRDTTGVIAISLAAMALAAPAAARVASPAPDERRHPRYACPDAVDYAARVALPAYAGMAVGAK